MLELGQLDAVVLAQPVGEGLALLADFVGRKVLGVDLLFDLAAPRRAFWISEFNWLPLLLQCSRWLTKRTVSAAKASLRR